MKKSVRSAILVALLAAAGVAGAQDVPPPAPPGFYEGGRQGVGRVEWSPKQRRQFREEMHLRREQWRQMSLEERLQLRRDIREAGRELYPLRHRRSSN